MAVVNYTPKLCSVESCNLTVKAKGYCSKHYTQSKRGGIKQSAKYCARCKNQISSKQSNAIYCSKRCGQLAWSESKGKDYIKSITKKSKPKKCSVRFNKCAICSKAFVSRKLSTICSKECASAKASVYAKQKYKEKRNKAEYKCKTCMSSFVTECYDKRRSFCSDKCSNKYSRISTPKKARQRARKYGVKYEPVNKIKVFDRDGWKCQICGINTPKSIMGLNRPQSPELDHRIPISKGGDHTYNNTQCACRRCNGLKGNRLTIGQHPLFN